MEYGATGRSLQTIKPNFRKFRDKMQILETFFHLAANWFQNSTEEGIFFSQLFSFYLAHKIIAALIFYFVCQVYKRFCDNGKITMPIPPEEMHTTSNSSINRKTMWKWGATLKTKKTKLKVTLEMVFRVENLPCPSSKLLIAHSSFGIWLAA